MPFLGIPTSYELKLLRERMDLISRISELKLELKYKERLEKQSEQLEVQKEQLEDIKNKINNLSIE